MKLLNGLALAALTLAATTGVGVAQDEYKIGIIAPTSGPVATVGLRQLKTYQWWMKDINETGGINGHQIRIIHCNDQASPERAVTCARDLLSQGIVMLLNSSVTGPIRAVMPLVENGPIMITPSPNVMPAPSTFVFQAGPSDRDLTEGMAAYLLENGIEKLGMVAATDASGERGIASAREVFPERGIELTTTRIDLRATDAFTQLAKLASADVEAFYSSYSGGSAAAVVKSFSQLGFTQPLIVSYANISDAFIQLIRNDVPERLLGTGLKGMAPERLTDPQERERAVAFAKSYQAFAGETIDQLNLAALAVADTAAAVLRNVKDPTDAEAAREYLHTHPVKSFQTLHYSAETHVGMGADDTLVLELRDGAWVAAEPIK